MKLAAKLDGLMAENQYPVTSFADDYDGKREGAGSKHGRLGAISTLNGLTIVDKHTDVHEEEGWITIPCKELPDGWTEESDMLPFRSLDRPFVFPGEQVHILACLSACKQDVETITSLNPAEVTSKSGVGQNTKKHNVQTEQGPTQVSKVESSDLTEGKMNHKNKVAAESALRMEEYRRKTEALLKRFRNSHFFARIAEADEALWSRRKTQETFPGSTSTIGGKFLPVESSNDVNKEPPLNVDRGSLDASTSGGVAKNDVKCSLLANGDIVVLLQEISCEFVMQVLLQVTIGVDFLRDPVLEVLQFEKYQEAALTSGCSEDLGHTKQDPYGDLLKWLLPLRNSVSTPHFFPPPQMSSSPNARSSLTKPNAPSSFGSQNFLLGQFRSHSMTSLSSKSVPSPTPLTSSSRPHVGLEDWDQYLSDKSGSERSGEGLLSFRGVPLEPERFSVRCGLEGIYIPGRRWRRKIEIIQPLEINCSVVDCNTEDLLCVQIKNVSPAHAPDIVIYLDAITVIFEEALEGGPPLSLPTVCIEAGNDHGLPDLALRKDEEHSFMLKPATSFRSSNAQGEKSSRPSLWAGSARSSLYSFSNVDRCAFPANKYSVLVSCRCNYTGSRLFFKQPTNWRPHIQKDLLISVASQMSKQILGPHDRITRLPIQVLTLQASNLTNEDLTLTLLAPSSLTSPSVVSLSCSSASPLSPSDESVARTSGDMQGISLQRLCAASKVLDQKWGDDGWWRPDSFNEQTISISDVIPRNGMGHTHLWLKSRVPLGCVPSRSTVTIELELLPLTDGIITLDSLQINVEKGLSYIPEQPLKINATSSISSGAI
ncbi:uncharacterized protein LOC112522732 [Cynara cardunculus var. scolymus]|uniref:uncharacterized protein LOC112522732 n=1 Tax=Cynara cardunculus var. scolymus TaxID=59895 RepID=UPI000D625CC1|nr:uncharacterized protein LOC112522732 [Cynara cardunculus var. scolymus]